MKKKTLCKNVLRLGLMMGVIVLMCTMLMHGTSVFAAECGGLQTSIIDCEENEGGVWHILNLVIDIFSIGVGILGVIGISIVGIQILTANGNVAQEKKAKTRLAEIVIGSVAYVALFAVSQWLLPGGLINSQLNLQNLGTTVQIKEQMQSQNENRNQGDSNDGMAGSNSKTQTTKAQKLSDVAWRLATGKIGYATVANATGYYDYMKKNCYGIGGGDCGRGNAGYRTFCSGFVYNVVRYSGADPNYPMKLTGKQLAYANSSSRWKNVTSVVNGKTSKLKPGDVLIKNGHTLIITANSKGQLYTAQAAVGNFEPKVSKIAGKTTLDGSAGNLSNYQVFRIVK